ncbi:MAG: ATP-binding protein, partial [Oceanospirillales bacterium]|nr:ATP-binding protein [Oceanospirillales bacterium]
LQQVLVNLVSNAIKYTHQEQTPRVRIRSFQTGEHDVIEVEDNGVGIPADQLVHIFDKHSRLHTESTSRYGYGLGLYNARKLILAGGGSIEVRSEPGQGSCFTLRLKSSPESPPQKRPCEVEHG